MGLELGHGHHQVCIENGPRQGQLSEPGKVTAQRNGVHLVMVQIDE